MLARNKVEEDFSAHEFDLDMGSQDNLSANSDPHQILELEQSALDDFADEGSQPLTYNENWRALVGDVIREEDNEGEEEPVSSLPASEQVTSTLAHVVPSAAANLTSKQSALQALLKEIETVASKLTESPTALSAANSKTSDA